MKLGILDSAHHEINNTFAAMFQPLKQPFYLDNTYRLASTVIHLVLSGSAVSGLPWLVSTNYSASSLQYLSNKYVVRMQYTKDPY